MPDEKQRNAKVSVALRRIDVINHFEFPDGERILRQATAVAPRIARLKKRAHDVGIPTVYVDDNFGVWRSDAAWLLAYSLRPEAAGRAFVEKIKPDCGSSKLSPEARCEVRMADDHSGLRSANAGNARQHQGCAEAPRISSGTF